MRHPRLNRQLPLAGLLIILAACSDGGQPGPSSPSFGTAVATGSTDPSAIASSPSAPVGVIRTQCRNARGRDVSCTGDGELSAATPSAWKLGPDALPLGPESLDEDRVVTDLVPGMTHYRILRGYASLDDGFEAEAGLAMNEAEAVALEALVRAAGFTSKRVTAAHTDAERSNTGQWIRVAQRFTAYQQADAVVKTLLDGGLKKARRRYTAEDGLPTTGPWAINVLAVRPQFGGVVKAVLGTGIVPGKGTTTATAARVGALAAINAGFFVVGPEQGTEGDLAGLSVIDGRLVSEGVEGRPAFFMDVNGGARSAHIEHGISTVLTLMAGDGQSIRIDGVNRKPGLNFSCGNPNDVEATVALHDVTCTDPNEIVAFGPDFGDKADAGDGVEVSVDAGGIVQDVRATRGGTIPVDGGRLIQGIGTGAQWLQAHAAPGTPLHFDQRLQNDNGEAIALQPGRWAVNGGPTLRRNGGDVPAAQIIREGFGIRSVPGVPSTYANADRAFFVNDWYIRRNPHAAVGIADDGTLLFVTVDGRGPRYSAGMSVAELADFMRRLGARDAMKLDGGGSTMMVVNGQPQDVPSDATGERPDGDAIVIMP